MTKHKLLEIGRSVACTISIGHRRQLGWWRGDIVTQEIEEDRIVLRNLTPHALKRVHKEREYGDAIRDRAERAV